MASYKNLASLPQIEILKKIQGVRREQVQDTDLTGHEKVQDVECIAQEQIQDIDSIGQEQVQDMESTGEEQVQDTDSLRLEQSWDMKTISEGEVGDTNEDILKIPLNKVMLEVIFFIFKVMYDYDKVSYVITGPCSLRLMVLWCFRNGVVAASECGREWVMSSFCITLKKNFFSVTSANNVPEQLFNEILDKNGATYEALIQGLVNVSNIGLIFCKILRKFLIFFSINTTGEHFRCLMK